MNIKELDATIGTLKERLKAEYVSPEIEVYSRIIGYFRPLSEFNLGKKEEFRQRVNFKLKEARDGMRA